MQDSAGADFVFAARLTTQRDSVRVDPGFRRREIVGENPARAVFVRAGSVGAGSRSQERPIMSVMLSYP